MGNQEQTPHRRAIGLSRSETICEVTALEVGTTPKHPKESKGKAADLVACRAEPVHWTATALVNGKVIY